ncbi:MAG TPA: hypothetical protein VL101_15615 [Nordella sp.]|nr:hypothetical protein [Nordella sp.]
MAIASGKDILTPQALAALRAHPHFPEALRASAASLITLHRRNRLMSWFLSDRPLALIGHAVIYLHLEGGADDPLSGLTPSRFRSFCQTNDLCSPGRAGAILAFMRMTGHIEAVPHPGDRRVTQLRPSEKLMEIARARLERQFAAIALLRPDIAPAIDALGDPDFEAALFHNLGTWLISGSRVLDHAPSLHLFAGRDAGMLILYSLMLAGEPDDRPVPMKPVPISISAIAKQFQVSRTHVLRLIRDAEKDGLLTRGGVKAETITLSPGLGQDLQNMQAGLFQLLATCAAEALATVPERIIPTRIAV